MSPLVSEQLLAAARDEELPWHGPRAARVLSRAQATLGSRRPLGAMGRYGASLAAGTALVALLLRAASGSPELARSSPPSGTATGAIAASGDPLALGDAGLRAD